MKMMRSLAVFFLLLSSPALAADPCRARGNDLGKAYEVFLHIVETQGQAQADDFRKKYYSREAVAFQRECIDAKACQRFRDDYQRSAREKVCIGNTPLCIPEESDPDYYAMLYSYLTLVCPQ